MKHISLALAQALGLHGTLTATAWTPAPNMPLEDWIRAGEALAAVESGASWWIGDWWAFGEHAYGNRKALVDREDWRGPAFDTCAAAARVSRDFAACRRRQVLSFAHHREAAGLEPSEADAALDWCEETIAETGKPRSTRELRGRLRETRRVANTNVLRWPIGRYGLIYCDPPWRYEHSRTSSREIENHYPTMELAEICALPVESLAADNCMMFMWATNPKLTEAVAVLDCWGFTYRTNFVWVKDKVGMGYYARGQHELLLVAKRGNIPAPAESERVSSVFYTERTEHSAKPDEFYELIERQYPTLPKIELFARQSRDGWDVWGNEVSLVA